MKLEFSGQIFEKYLNTWMKIRPVGAEFSLQTTEHEEADSRFPKFCERA